MITELKAGVDGTDYTLRCTINTINTAGRNRQLVRNAWVKVRLTDEA